MLDSLLIKNFRSLEHLEVPKLGRVNLMVGKNNSGKSTVLEALRILFSEEGRQALLDANDRDLRRYEEALQEQIQAVRSALQGAMTAHAERLKAMETAAEALSAIVREESSSRTRTRHLLFATAGAALGAGLCFMTLKLL